MLVLRVPISSYESFIELSAMRGIELYHIGPYVKKLLVGLFELVYEIHLVLVRYCHVFMDREKITK